MMLISLQMYGGTASVDAQEKKPVNIEMDKMITYDVERCVAEGSGTLRGTIGIFSKFPKSEEEVPCTRKCENNIIW